MLHATGAQHNGFERKLSLSLSLSLSTTTTARGVFAGDNSLQHKGVGLQQTAMSQTQGLVDKSVSVANIARAEEDAQRAASPESGG